VRQLPYDVLVVGAGHNGLTAAALLARRGFRVRVVERLPRAGGAAPMEELVPGYRF
jgi:phytoene dehydrogenase-like protein